MNTKPPGFFKARLHQIKETKNLVINILKDSSKVAKDSKQEYKGWISQAREKIKNPAYANFELGKDFYDDGLISDAIIRFKLALLMNKELSEAQLWLAKSYIAKGDYARAEKHLTPYVEKSEKTEELKYFLSLVRPEGKNTYPNSLIIQNYFKLFSKFFNQNYCLKFNHQGFSSVFERVNSRYTDKKKELQILEIGCGPGILASKLKTNFNKSQITGIDFSPEMISICKNLKIELKPEVDNDVIDLTKSEPEVKNISVYDKLIRKDFFKTHEELEKKYDVIVCRGLLHYVEDLTKFLDIISGLLVKNGIFVCYINENYSKQKKQDIMQNCSFPFYLEIRQHSKAAIEKYGQNSSLNLDFTEKFEIENNTPANIYLFEKQ